MKTCAWLANLAAGIAVTQVGTTAVTTDELLFLLRDEKVNTAERKILTLPELMQQLKTWKGDKYVVGFTNGCFDLIHPGHVSLLAQARAQCDRLIVGLNSDASVRRLKGKKRPVQGEMARAIVLASMEPVDAVVMFDEDTPRSLIEEIRPDVLVKGADYSREEVVGEDIVAGYGGQVVLAKLVPGRAPAVQSTV